MLDELKCVEAFPPECSCHLLRHICEKLLAFKEDGPFQVYGSVLRRESAPCWDGDAEFNAQSIKDLVERRFKGKGVLCVPWTKAGRTDGKARACCANGGPHTLETQNHVRDVENSGH